LQRRLANRVGRPFAVRGGGPPPSRQGRRAVQAGSRSAPRSAKPRSAPSSEGGDAAPLERRGWRRSRAQRSRSRRSSRGSADLVAGQPVGRPGEAGFDAGCRNAPSHPSASPSRGRPGPTDPGAGGTASAVRRGRGRQGRRRNGGPRGATAARGPAAQAGEGSRGFPRPPGRRGRVHSVEAARPQTTSCGATIRTPIQARSRSFGIVEAHPGGTITLTRPASPHLSPIESSRRTASTAPCRAGSPAIFEFGLPLPRGPTIEADSRASSPADLHVPR